MQRFVLFTLVMVLLFTGTLSAQQYRSIDGRGNNLQQPEWGSQGATLRTMTSIGYRDGISQPGGIGRPNPRRVSNQLFAQDSIFSDRMQLSDYTWVFGQFIDHDVIAVLNDPTEVASIPVDFPDPFMNPAGTFTAFIPMNRSLSVVGTGTDVSNPRRFANDITSWLDASGVYGSDTARASWLRTHVDGKLKTSSGNLMPYNTLTGELDGEIDPTTPHMDNENPFNDKLFVAGDARANENPLLAGLHILFVREHNRLCDQILLEHDDWDDEQIYQQARAIVCGFMQVIVFEEWLPAMGVNLPPYEGYDPSANPNISNVFSAAAFRLGHTLLNGNILRLDSDGNQLAEGNLRLKDAFFNPLAIADVGGLEPYFKGMAVQIQQEMDSKVINDVRNFLFGPPGSGAGGLDLAAININRGRERGLPDFNTVRENFGLAPHTDFQSICSDTIVSGILEELYGDVNDIDPWVGMLAEDHMNSEILFGETIMAIMQQQFGDLRDGDRYYYEIDPALTEEEKDLIRNTTMRDIIMRNTNIDILQDNVFEAMPHDSVCSAPTSRMALNGIVQTEDGKNLSNVTIQLDGDEPSINRSTTDSTGNFAFDNVLACESYQLRPVKNDSYRNGVSTYDLVLISKHVLDIEKLDSPYKIIAADVNNSKTVTAIDLVDIRKLVLKLTDNFPGNTAWRFVDAAHQFTNGERPLDEAFPEAVAIPSLLDTSMVRFVAIKTGDVSGNVDVNTVRGTSEERGAVGNFVLRTVDRELRAGRTAMISFIAEDIASVAGYQFTLDYDESQLEVLQIVTQDLEGLDKNNFGHFPKDGVITTSWNGLAKTATKESRLFSLLVRPRADVLVSEVLQINSAYTAAEAYNQELNLLNVSLQFPQPAVAQTGALQLFQNTPNPFHTHTQISFELPESMNATLTIFDMSGKEIYQLNQNFVAGFHAIDVDASNLPTEGVLYYRLDTPAGSVTQRMVRMD